MFSEQMNKRLEILKLKLLLGKKLNFISSLLATMNVVDMKDEPDWEEYKKKGVPSAYVCGAKMAINEDWFMSLSEELQEAVLIHEVMHIAKLHPIRGLDLEDEQARAIAFDTIVNRDVINMGYSEEEIKEAGGVVAQKYWDMSEEQIYYSLINNNKNNSNNKQGNPNGSNSNSKGNDKSNNNNNNKNNPDKPLQDLNNDVRASNDPQTQREVLAKVSQAMELAKSRGWETPNGLESFIDNLLNPKLKWNALLRKYLNELVPSNIRTWSRPNRRYPDTYRPSKDKDYGRIRNIEVYVDTSGSVSDSELQEYLTEINFMHKLMKPDQLTVYDFDTKIRSEHSFKSYDRITQLNFAGRGGTDYTDIMNQIKKHNPQFAVIFTDLYCNIPPKPNKHTHIIWIRTGGGDNYSVPSYGKVFHYDKAK